MLKSLWILFALAFFLQCNQQKVIKPANLDKHSLLSLFEVECPAPDKWQDQSDGDRIKYNNGRCALLMEPDLNAQILGLIHPWMRKMRVGIPQDKEFMHVDIVDNECLTMNIFFASKSRSMALYYREDPGITKRKCLEQEYRAQVYYKRDRVLSWAVDLLKKYSLDRSLKATQ